MFCRKDTTAILIYSDYGEVSEDWNGCLFNKSTSSSEDHKLNKLDFQRESPARVRPYFASIIREFTRNINWLLFPLKLSEKGRLKFNLLKLAGSKILQRPLLFQRGYAQFQVLALLKYWKKESLSLLLPIHFPQSQRVKL